MTLKATIPGPQGLSGPSHTTVGQRNYFTIFFRTLRQFHIIIKEVGKVELR